MAVIRVYTTGNSVGVDGYLQKRFTADGLALQSNINIAKGYLGRLRRDTGKAGVSRDFEAGEYQEPGVADLLSSGVVSRFGRPIFNDLLLAFGDVEVMIIDALIDVTLSNTIIKTPVQGRRGTVKEYVNSDDYHISISGHIISELKDHYPVEQVKALVQVIETQGSPIEVYSEYLSLFGITNIVLENHKFNQSKDGFQNMQPFQLQFVSDTATPLIIEEEQANADTLNP